MDCRGVLVNLASALCLSVALVVSAQAAECPRDDALGTSRVIAVDAAATPRVGSKGFQALPLGDREVVLTFDDGPSPATDGKVLAALAEQCVRATFFLIGKQASEHPELVRQIAAAGHSIGHHTLSHHNLRVMKPDEAADEINKGIGAVEMAQNGVSTTTPSTPFFRYPGFQMSQQTLDDLEKRRIVVFGADVIADDWIPMTPEAQLKLLTDRLKAAGKGIILLHDPQLQTAAVLPAFLRYLRDNGYSVVHVVPREAARPVADMDKAKNVNNSNN
jgi:peptidoglycan/xylan/chitin deacetylase (PgdA/CDA1 family)